MGSGALTMRQVVLIAGVAEVLGAVTLGKGVADTLTKKISYLHQDDCWDCDGGVECCPWRVNSGGECGA